MLSAEDNALLTQTGPGTPMGELMRRYWIPITLSERLQAGGAPVPIEILSERLVAYRDPAGATGLLGEFCPHRLASLALARNEECGLRCIYHAWKIGPDGTILETPPEPPEVSLASKVRHTAYPTREAGGILWAYMGPADSEPPFPMWAFNVVPVENVYPTHAFQECNWLQGLEGDLDAAHGPYLHYTADEAEAQQQAKNRANEYIFDKRPKAAAVTTGWGVQSVFRYLHKSGDEATFWIHPFIPPFFTLFESNLMDITGGLMHAWVPSNDNNHFVWSVSWSEDGPISQEFRDYIDTTRGYGDVNPDNNYRANSWNGNGFTQDRARMADGSSFSGIQGILQQDLAVQHSMGPVVDRTKEHLTSGDTVLVQVRRYLLDLVRAHDGGTGTPPGLDDGKLYRDLKFSAFTGDPDTSMRELARG
ncbi:Rieske 2Fe-2S domain-containing protein [Dactylosporangium sp. CA-233914]|uniref:Rieske 2Fe-2S domain-containing protein n=1 Tax=Dactylosporangium sp. CA-233914 TaxID=3239934 RepID=UPI003D8CFC2C